MVEVPCPKCRHLLLYSPELEGTRGLCKACNHIFTISSHPEVASRTERSFPFECPHCHKFFEGKDGMQGKQGKCDQCGQVFEIQPTLARFEQLKPEPENSIAAPSELRAAAKPISKTSSKQRRNQKRSSPKGRNRKQLHTRNQLNLQRQRQYPTHQQQAFPTPFGSRFQMLAGIKGQANPFQAYMLRAMSRAMRKGCLEDVSDWLRRIY
jgi:hypothetical protein